MLPDNFSGYHLLPTPFPRTRSLILHTKKPHGSFSDTKWSTNFLPSAQFIRGQTNLSPRLSFPKTGCSTRGSPSTGDFQEGLWYHTSYPPSNGPAHKAEETGARCPQILKKPKGKLSHSVPFWQCL